MGSSHTRPKLTQVVPSHSPVDTEEQRISHVTSHWTIEPLQSPPEEQQGCLGMRKNTQLPPLRQEVPLTFSPLTAGSISHSHSTNVGHSIIHSHPPRRLQALQPLTVPVSGILLQGTEQRGGAAHHSFTHGQGGHCGTSNFLQGGVLEAQVVLSRQAHSQHRSHRRRIRELQEQRERRRQGRTIFTSSSEHKLTKGMMGMESRRYTW
ncbi:hypothetical protein AGOR_G00107300 [Albula goreensis]|uniref:Uncharacterized protein n=1 Tax=Albula goreensis TaxID=1534307 RepID=A0A8T3DHN3_9TELE|nr:hypothetical protein AGOR_G00107300 [Albula goreensis]